MKSEHFHPKPIEPLVVAFYLPQFHPIPENDEAWGRGFTEWTNVARARPRFHGHRQPVLPADLGFYDLRLDSSRREQMRLAREHAIDAFCWYHYWFHGRRLLHEPFDRMRADPEEDLPFLLCWANESWTRAWSGRSGQILQQQCYSPDDDLRHIEFLIEQFHDPRYVRIDGSPVLLVYQPMDLPSMAETAERWRTRADLSGLDGIVLLGVESFRTRIPDPGRLGLDGVVQQQPNLRLVRPASSAALRRVVSAVTPLPPHPRIVRYPYDRLARQAERSVDADQPARFPTVCPGWDNTPRRNRGAVVLTGATPERYEQWVAHTVASTRSPILFVNAWNEWAEGAHLEPDLVNGRAFLDAHARGVHRGRTAR